MAEKVYSINPTQNVYRILCLHIINLQKHYIKCDFYWTVSTTWFFVT